jgi:hypothetical protein
MSIKVEETENKRFMQASNTKVTASEEIVVDGVRRTIQGTAVGDDAATLTPVALKDLDRARDEKTK